MTTTHDRRDGLGASDVAAMLGLSPFTSPSSIVGEKRGETEPFAGNEHTDMGTRIEPVLMETFASRYGVTLVRGADDDRLPLFSLMYPCIKTFAGCDAMFADGSALVEFKNVGAKSARFWGDEGDTVYPKHYEIQVRTYLHLYGVEVGYLAAYFGGADFRVYPITRDIPWELEHLGEAQRRWDMWVAGDQSPPTDGSDSTTAYLKVKFPVAKDPSILNVPLTDEETTKALFAWKMAKADKEAAERIEDAARNAVVGIIGSASGLSGRFGQVTYKNNKSSDKTDWKAVAETLGRYMDPDRLRVAITTNTKTVPGARVLRAKWAGEIEQGATDE